MECFACLTVKYISSFQIVLFLSLNELVKSLLRYNQINAVGTACRMGVEGCKELIQGWYRQWMENPDHNP